LCFGNQLLADGYFQGSILSHLKKRGKRLNEHDQTCFR